MARKTITLSEKTFNRFDRATSAFENDSGNLPPEQKRPYGGKNYWYGKILNAGPAAEADYSVNTNLYWVKKLYVNDTSTIAQEATVDVDESNPIHITATDITDGSRLAVDTIVQIYWEINQNNVIKHLIVNADSKLLSTILIAEEASVIEVYVSGTDPLTESFKALKPPELQGAIAQIGTKYIYPRYCAGDVIWLASIPTTTVGADTINHVDAHMRDLDDCPEVCSDTTVLKYTKSCATDGDIEAFDDCPSVIYILPGAGEPVSPIQAELGEDCCKMSCCYILAGEVTGIKPTCPVPQVTAIADCDDCSTSKCAKLLQCCGTADSWIVRKWSSLFAPDIVNTWGDIRGKVIKIEAGSDVCYQVPTAPLTAAELAASAPLTAACASQISLGSVSGEAISVVSADCDGCVPAWAAYTNCDGGYANTTAQNVRWTDWVLQNGLTAGMVFKSSGSCWTVGARTEGCLDSGDTFSTPAMEEAFATCELCQLYCVEITNCETIPSSMTVDWDDVSAFAGTIVKIGSSPICWTIPATYDGLCGTTIPAPLTGAVSATGHSACIDCVQETVTLTECGGAGTYVVYWDWVSAYASQVIKISNAGSGCTSTCWTVPADHDVTPSAVDETTTTVYESYADCTSCADVYDLTLCPIAGIASGITIIVKALGLSVLVGSVVKLSNGLCYTVDGINADVSPNVICEAISELMATCDLCTPTPVCIDECSASTTALGTGNGVSQAAAETAAIAAAKANAVTLCGTDDNIDYCSCGTVLESYEDTVAAEWNSIAYVCFTCICSSSTNLAKVLMGRGDEDAVYKEEVASGVNCDTVIANHPSYDGCADPFFVSETAEYVSNVELEMQEYADGGTIVPTTGYTNTGQTGDYVASITGECDDPDVIITGTLKFTALNMKLTKKKTCFVYNTGKTCVAPTAQCDTGTLCEG